MEIIFWIIIGFLGLCGALAVGALIYLLIVAIFSPEIDYTSTRPARPPKQRIVYDEEDHELSPVELVMKYKIPLTDAEFDRVVFDGHFARQVLDQNFVQQQLNDMETANRVHQTAHQMAMDAHQHANNMAQQHMDMHNDMFNNSCCGNPFF